VLTRSKSPMLKLLSESADMTDQNHFLKAPKA